MTSDPHQYGHSKANATESGRLAEALEKYMRRMESGHSIDKEEFLGQYPNIGDELKQCLAGLDLVENLAPSLRGQESRPQTTEPVEEAGSPLALKTLGDYRILREIGRGGMGVVYEAEQLSLDRRVALKVLPLASFLDERQLRRFKNEARAAAALKHPNIVSVYGVGSERSVHFYAMELIEGVDLSTAIRQIHSAEKAPVAQKANDTTPVAKLSTQHTDTRRQFFPSVARLGKQAADALHFAHQEGVIHRDIKPANLLLDRDGNVHIADFGLAQFGTGEDLTLTGDTVGTLRYMSPEQVIGKQVVDQRTDVYSLGMTLYELLVGKPALGSTSRHALLKDVVETTPARLRSLVPDVPADLATIVERAIAKDREDRYASMDELAADLNRFLTHRPILAKPPTLFQRAKKWCVRNRRIAATAAAVLVTLLAGLAFSLNQWQQAFDAKTQSASEVYASNMLLAYEAYNVGDVRNAQHHFRKATVANTEQQNEFEWQYMAAILERAENQATQIRCDHPPTCLEFSLDGSSIYVAHQFGIEKWDVASAEQIWSRNLSSDGYRVFVVNPGKDELYATTGSRLFVIDSETGTEKLAYKFDLPADRFFLAVRLAADASQLLLVTNYANYSVRDTEIHSYDLSTGEAGRIEAEDVAEIERFAVDPRGKYIATSHRDHSVWLRDPVDWSLVKNIGQHHSTVSQLQFSQDGGLLLSGAGDFRVQGWDTKPRIWDVVQRREFREWPLGTVGQDVSLAPNQVAYAIASPSGGIAMHFPAQEHTAILRGHRAPVRLIVWSSDSRSFASVAESTVRIWKLNQPQKNSPTTATKFMSLAVLDEHTAFASGECWDHTLNSKVIMKVDVDRSHASPFAKTEELPTGIGLDVANRRLFCSQHVIGGQSWELDSTADQGDSLSFTGTACEMALSHDARMLAVGKYLDSTPEGPQNRIEIWDVSTSPMRKVLDYPMESIPVALEFSPNDQLLAYFDWSANVVVIDLSTNQRVFSRKISQLMGFDMCFSSCGEYLAAIDADRQVWLWRTKDWSQIGEPLPHRSDLRGLAFSPNSKRLVTTAVDRTVSVWEIENQHLLARIQLEGASPSAVAFTPSGRKLICCHADMTVSVLNSDAENKYRTLRRTKERTRNESSGTDSK